MENPHVYDFVDEMAEALKTQLKEDEKVWGDTWLHRTKEGQEGRIREEFDNYFDQFDYADVPVPWLKIIGNATIAWVRENNPELFSE